VNILISDLSVRATLNSTQLDIVESALALILQVEATAERKIVLSKYTIQDEKLLILTKLSDIFADAIAVLTAFASVNTSSTTTPSVEVMATSEKFFDLVTSYNVQLSSLGRFSLNNCRYWYVQYLVLPIGWGWLDSG
jgi:hypothetical protein